MRLFGGGERWQLCVPGAWVLEHPASWPFSSMSCSMLMRLPPLLPSLISLPPFHWCLPSLAPSSPSAHHQVRGPGQHPAAASGGYAHRAPRPGLVLLRLLALPLPLRALPQAAGGPRPGAQAPAGLTSCRASLPIPLPRPLCSPPPAINSWHPCVPICSGSTPTTTTPTRMRRPSATTQTCWHTTTPRRRPARRSACSGMTPAAGPACWRDAHPAFRWPRCRLHPCTLTNCSSTARSCPCLFLQPTFHRHACRCCMYQQRVPSLYSLPVCWHLLCPDAYPFHDLSFPLHPLHPA